PQELRQRLGIETPEHVAVHLEVAEVGSRAAAALVDTVVTALGSLALWWLVVVIILARPGAALEGWLLAVVLLLLGFGLLGYFILLEALNGGRTLGKQLLGIRVVMETGRAVTPTAAIVRNLVRLLDCYFPLLPFLPGLVMVFLHNRNQRLGDLAAGTIVVRDRPADWGLGPAPLPADEPVEIPACAARYREVAADLARARTYGVDPRVIEYLERVVSAGHNALYRARGRGRAPVARYLLRDFPAAVVQSWRQVLAASLLFAVPAIIGYGVIRGRPELADDVLPPVMVSRAEQAADHAARGIGYGQSRKEDLPVIASAIISNNIAVAFWAFVGGMLAGTL